MRASSSYFRDPLTTHATFSLFAYSIALDHHPLNNPFRLYCLSLHAPRGCGFECHQRSRFVSQITLTPVLPLIRLSFSKMSAFGPYWNYFVDFCCKSTSFLALFLWRNSLDLPWYLLSPTCTQPSSTKMIFALCTKFDLVKIRESAPSRDHPREQEVLVCKERRPEEAFDSYDPIYYVDVFFERSQLKELMKFWDITSQ